MPSQAQIWAEGFDLGPERQLSPLPGDDIDLIQGYYELERNERYATQLAISHHREKVVLWYRTLSFYARALDIPRVITGDNLWLTQWRILRLGISASKAALDATLAGYYVIAFGAIRHLSECWFGIQHLRLFPATVDGYYAAEPDDEQVILDKIGERINEVIEVFKNDPQRRDETPATFLRRSRESRYLEAGVDGDGPHFPS